MPKQGKLRSVAARNLHVLGAKSGSKGPDSPGRRAVGAVAANREAYLPGVDAGRKPGRPFRARREAVPKLPKYLGKIGTQVASPPGSVLKLP